MLIIDPFLLKTQRHVPDRKYCDELVDLLRPVLASSDTLRIVTGRDRSAKICALVSAGLRRSHPKVQMRVQIDTAFYDRYWIADRVRGVMTGGSFSTVGRKHFLVAELSSSDVKEILAEVDVKAFIPVR